MNNNCSFFFYLVLQLYYREWFYMKFKVSNLDTMTRKAILNEYKTTHNLEEIEKKYDVARNTILAYLTRENIVYPKSDAASFKVDGDKLLIISDTHIGSKNQNQIYIDEAYNMGLKNGVSACIHLGDLIQGEYNRTDRTVKHQLKYLRDFYPFIREFNTYVLLGNHDYNVFENNIDAKKFLLMLQKFTILGYKKAYFKWNNYLYAMEHKVKQLNDEMYLEDCAADFIGHGHELKIKSESKLKTPTLSDDIINQTNGAVPGFLVANMYGDTLSVDTYEFKDKKAILKKENYFERNLCDAYKVR